MSFIPPTAELIDVAKLVVLPAAGVAAGIFLIGPRLFGRWSTGIFAIAALVAGFLAANHFREALTFRLGARYPWRMQELGRALYWAVTTSKSPIPAREWWPWMMAVALALGWLLERIGWLAMALFCVFVAWLLVDQDSGQQRAFWAAAVAAACLLNWLVLRALSGNAGYTPTSHLSALAFAGGGIVILHAHSARFTDVAVMMSSALMGLAAVEYLTMDSPRAVNAASAIGLPCLMLIAQQNTFSNVPVTSFAVAAIAPSVAIVMLWLPTRWRGVAGVVATLFVSGIAVTLAARAEPLDFS